MFDPDYQAGFLNHSQKSSMKIFSITVSLILICSLAFAQQEIKIEDASKHEGDSVKICTKIFGARFFENSNRMPTLLNAGAKYPDALLTIVVFGENRGNFKNKPEAYYTGKNICVTGRIVFYKGKPEIIITREEEISIKE